MLNRLRLKDIIDSLDLSEDLKTFVTNTALAGKGGFEIITEDSRTTYLPIFPKDKEILIVDKKSLKEHIYSMSFCELKKMVSVMNIGETTTFVRIIVDLWGHSGIPGGETDKYLGRLKIEIEEIAFILSLLEIRK